MAIKYGSPIRATGRKTGPTPKVGLTDDRYYPGQEPGAVPLRGNTWVSYPLKNAADGGRTVRSGRGVGSKVEISKRPDEINRVPENQRTYASWRSPSVHEDAQRLRRSHVDGWATKPTPVRRSDKLRGRVRPTEGRIIRKEPER